MFPTFNPDSITSTLIVPETVIGDPVTATRPVVPVNATLVTVPPAAAFGLTHIALLPSGETARTLPAEPNAFSPVPPLVTGTIPPMFAWFKFASTTSTVKVPVVVIGPPPTVTLLEPAAISTEVTVPLSIPDGNAQVYAEPVQVNT